MEAIDILRRARALISDPSRWTRGATARDARGTQCTAASSDAARWCAIGALQRMHIELCGDDDAALQAESLMEAVAIDGWGVYLSSVNDRHGHDTIMAIFRLAIARARAAA